MKKEIEMVCGSCGASNEIDLPSVQEAARDDAARLTDHEVAERYRAAVEVALEFFPENMRRLPRSWIARASDAELLERGARMLTLMLQPAG